MGLEDREWWREPRERPRRWPTVVVVVVVAAVIGGFIQLRGLPQDWKVGGEHGAPRLGLSLGFGSDGPSYPRRDRWRTYLASETTCPGGEDRDAPTDEQVRTMLCLIDYARAKAGLKPLPDNPLLARAAELKGRDIIACKDFNHDACGKDPHAVSVLAGYPNVPWGENLYASAGPNGAPRPALDGWLNSDGHRENLFNPAWTEQGVALLTAPRFAGGGDAALWVSEFGAR